MRLQRFFFKLFYAEFIHTACTAPAYQRLGSADMFAHLLSAWRQSAVTMALAGLYFKETERCRYINGAAGVAAGYRQVAGVLVKKKDTKNMTG